MPDEANVLGGERPVEAEVAAQRHRVGGCGPVPEHDLDGVARQQVEEGEDQRHDAEHGGQEEDQPPAGEGAHQSSQAAARLRRSPLGDGSNPRSRRVCTAIRSSHHRGTIGTSCASRRCTRA